MILLVVCHGQEIFPEYSERRTEKSRDELQVSNLKVQRVLSSHKVAPLQVKIFPLESKVCVFLMCTTFYFLCVCERSGEASECDWDVCRAEQWHHQQKTNVVKNRGGDTACARGWPLDNYFCFFMMSSTRNSRHRVRNFDGFNWVNLLCTGMFNGWGPEPTTAASDGRVPGSWCEWLHGGQGQKEEAAAECSHMGKEGWGCWGTSTVIFFVFFSR